MINLKFKKIIRGEYTSSYKGYDVEISKNYESRTWSMEIRKPNGGILISDIVGTYSDAKAFAEDEIFNNL